MTAILVVRNSGDSGAAVFALPMCGDPSRRRNYARPMPPEYECVIARMGSLLPYRRARTLLSEFLPLGDVPAVETTRRRTMRVALAWSSKRWRANLPHRRLRRILFPSPSTAAMCGRSEVTRFARLR